MELFKQNEEVIDLVLTPKGRELLAEGKFKPSSYSFHDIDITYEANNSELQNDIVNRIKNTVRMKPLSYYRNGNFYRDGKTGKITKVQFLSNQIGDKILGNQYAPAWKIDFKNNPDFQNFIQSGSLVTPKYYLVDITNNSFSNIIENNGLQETIPQININFYYQLVDTINFKDKDGKIYLKTFMIEDRDILLELQEINSFEENEFSNFNLEIYLENTTNGNLVPLFFDKEIPDEFSIQRYLSISFDNNADFQERIKIADIYGPGGRDTPTNC